MKFKIKKSAFGPRYLVSLDDDSIYWGYFNFHPLSVRRIMTLWNKAMTEKFGPNTKMMSWAKYIFPTYEDAVLAKIILENMLIPSKY